jgi:hypothetical protein
VPKYEFEELPFRVIEMGLFILLVLSYFLRNPKYIFHFYRKMSISIT